MSVIDTTSGKLSSLPRIEDGPAAWGDPQCHRRDPGGPFFVIGMNISIRAPGAVQLAVINSVGGDHIELYQLQERSGALVAAWRGCVESPGTGTVDAVAALPDGGLVASILCSDQLKPLPVCFEAGLSGHDTGWLFTWTPKTGLVRLPGSEASLNNGVQASRDGQEIYTVATGTKQLKIYSIPAQRYIRTIDLPFSPDNAKRAPDGRIIVGGTRNGAFCLGKPKCRNEAWVMAIDPANGRRELLLYAADGFLAGTTGGLLAGGHLYVSSMADPFILKIKQAK